MYTADLPVSVVEPRSVAPPVLRWRVSTRVALRFCVLYFGLYVGMTQMLPALLPLPIDVPSFGDSRAVQAVVARVAKSAFGVTSPLVVTGSGSGDKTYDWVFAFCLLVTAAAGTLLWSILDRRRPRYARLHTWFHLVMRFALGATMAGYGMVKAIPLQMPAPPLTRLLEPFGHFSPMGVLWYSIGASRPYEIFTGCAELTAAVLLFVPRTATLGALTALAVTVQIFVLNMTYDVPVKLFSFHLVVMSVVLLAPEARRLAAVLLSNGTAGPSTLAPIGKTRRARRAAVAAQLALAAWILGMNAHGARQSWFQYGGGAPKSPLYGIWDVERMTIDGVERAPLVTDFDRWRRVVFDRPTAVSFQRMDDAFSTHVAAIDAGAKTIVVMQGPPQQRVERGRFSFDRPQADRLILDGKLDGRPIRLRLALFDRDRFLLVTRGFNWIQEYPFNR